DECCCECGEALDGIICQRCACKSCGKSAHIGYNCPPKVPIISNPEPPSWNRPAVYDDDDDVDYTNAITPVLSTEEPDNSLKEISSGSTTTHSVISLPKYEAFSFYDDHIEEICSGSTTTQSDISLPEYDSFIFDLRMISFLLPIGVTLLMRSLAMNSLTSYLHRSMIVSTLGIFPIWVKDKQEKDKIRLKPDKNRKRLLTRCTSHMVSGIPLNSLRIGTRSSTLDFITSSDYVAEMVSRCSSPILRELSGSSVDKTGVIALV
nr:hypothetical protein [Tanacetum cinerariifolium]